MDVIYVIFAIARLFVFATYFIKTKSALRYYYIWIPALAAFAHDYFLLSDENSLCASHFLYLKMFLSWFAVVCYWRNLDAKNANILQVTRTALDYCKPMAVFLIMFTVLQCVTDDATEDPSFFFTIGLSLNIVCALIFLCLAWKSSVWKQQHSFLMFGCIFMLLPVHTTLQVIVDNLNDYHLLLTIHAKKILSVVLICTSLCEGVVPLRILASTLLQQIEWPDLKGEALRLIYYNNEKIIPSANQATITFASKVDETKTCVLKY